MNNTKTVLVFKHIVYSLLLLFLYILQSTPGLLIIHGIKPLLVIPVAISVAMFEGEFVGGIYGVAAGLLCDASGSSLFGYNGFLVCLFCVASGLLVIYLMRCNLLGCLLFSGIALAVRGSVEFLFAYGMWRHENIWRVYVSYTLPTVVYTLILTPFLFWMVRRLHRRFESLLTR